MIADASIEHADPACAIGIWGPVLISVWRAPPDANRAAALLRAQRKTIACSDPLASVIVVADVTGDLKFPDDGVRRSLAAAYQNNAGRKYVTATVIEAQGFAGAAIRAFLSGLVLLSGSRVPQRAFDARPPAVDWTTRVLREGGYACDPDALGRAVEAVVAAIPRAQAPCPPGTEPQRGAPAP